MNSYALWFRWALILGLLKDWFFALPGIFIPNAVLAFLGSGVATFPIWPAFGFLLFTLVTLFYIPAAVNPFRYQPNAWLAILARFAIALFFLVTGAGGGLLLGAADLILAVIQVGLLIMALYSRETVPA